VPKTEPSTKSSSDAEPGRLSAVNLKNALWETLSAIKSDLMQPSQGDAIAAQAREIIRTVKVQLQVAQQAKRAIPAEVIDFAEQP